MFEECILVLNLSKFHLVSMGQLTNKLLKLTDDDVE